MRWPSPNRLAAGAAASARRRPADPACALAASTALALAIVACSGRPSGVPRRVLIPEGATLRAAADSLASHDVVDAPWLFRLYAGFAWHGADVKPGTYHAAAPFGWHAGTRRRDFVVEGARADCHDPRRVGAARDRATTRARPGRAGGVARCCRPRLRAAVRVGATGPTLEGFLFPDTYFFPDGVSARAAVGEMVHEFEREWRPQWDSAARSLGMSRTEVVTLASIIVKKEARLADERPLISAVYHNRLRRHMPLQADPTIQYALGLSRRADHVQGPRDQVAVQHVSSPRAATRPDWIAGRREPRCRPRASCSAVPGICRCTGWAL